ncbi:processed acidic surface protein [Halalkalibacter krulwichiae]|uniref:Processed acidic surface protein n=1 Tax=Halalkalibacter krulwichiae TaxID=199441 RepID=A0A1X9MJ23_9BACI|nr:processed acidic surface protein [Halalkalibacter krulwichiae]ARK32690.1 hypothetical protein BkAM31D_24105 [Halalkalibacter krulwichiae]
MKGLFMSFLVVLGFVFAPAASYAAPSSSELAIYLKEIGWSKQQMEEHLDFYDLTIKDFESVTELKSFLGPVLTEKNLNKLLVEHGLTKEEATALLIEYGELEEGQAILDVYKFYDDLDFDLYFYNLTPITDENLQQLLNDYELTMDELLALLEENGDSLEYYEFIEDLEWSVDYYLYGSDIDFSEVDDLFSMIGLTDKELERLFEHFASLDYENPAFLEKLEELANRLMAFEDFEDPADLTAEQIAELLSIFKQLLDLFELDVKYYLVKEDEKKPVSLETLMTMTTTNGYGLLIEFYNKQGEFLADILFTADMFGPEIIQETGKDLKQVEKVVTKAKEKQDQKPVTKTEKGAKLPKTASDYVTNTAAGLAIAFGGFLLYRRFKSNHAA